MMRIFLLLATNIAVILMISLILSLFGLNTYLTAQGIDYRALLIFSFAYGMIGAGISLLLSKTMAKMSMGVKIIDNPTTNKEKQLVEMVKSLSQKANIGMPEVGIFDSPSPNAFATGWNKNNALVAISSGMLDSFTDEEVKAVLGHEIGHVANGDMITMTLIQGVLNSFVIFFSRVLAFLVASALSRDRNNGEGVSYGINMIFTIIFQILLGILASMIVAWFSRRREFRADYSGATLASKQAMINALSRLDKQATSTPLPESMNALMISGGKLANLFSSHPPIPERTEALNKLSI